MANMTVVIDLFIMCIVFFVIKAVLLYVLFISAVWRSIYNDVTKNWPSPKYNICVIEKETDHEHPKV